MGFESSFFVEDKTTSQRVAGAGRHCTRASRVSCRSSTPRRKATGWRLVVEGNTLERFVAALQPLKGSTIKASDVRAMMPSLGLSDKSYSYLLKKVIDNKLIKKTGKGQGTATRYTVLL